MTRRVFLYGCLFHILSLTCSVSWAQVDPTQVLVGRWEGTVELPRDSNQVLTINSVSPKNGGWVAGGRFAIPPGRGAPVTIDVLSQGGTIVLEFEAGGKEHNPFRLKLVGDHQLEGTGNFVIGPERKTDRVIKLEKVASK
jgi:hypothetical protein